MQEIFQNSKVTLSLEPCHFLFARLMPRRVAIFWTGGSDTFAKLRFKVSSLRGASFLPRRENARKRFGWSMFARVYLTIRSTKLPCEDRRGRSTRHRAKKMHRTLEDPLRERTRESRREKRATTCSNDWWAFKGVSTLHSLPSLSFSWKKDLRIGMHSHENGAWLQPGKCILENKHSGSLHQRAKQQTAPAFILRGNDFLTENYSIKLGNNGVKQMNYYCPLDR